MNFLAKENRLKAALHIVVMTISIIGMMQRDKVSEEASLFERIMIDTVSPIQSSIFTLKDETTSFFDNYIFLVDVKKNSEKLKRQIDDLEKKIFELEELQRENKRLKDLLKFGEDLAFNKVLARVIGWDANGNIKVIRINKGSDDGIKVESPVIASDGLVGYVYRVSESYADVITILDQNNRIDGIIVRTRSHGIVEGYSNGQCIMKYVTRSEPIVEGDLVMTSGLGKIYPKALRVGKVSKIERESYGITQFVEIEPAVDFGKLEEVIVLLPGQNQLVSNQERP